MMYTVCVNHEQSEYLQLTKDEIYSLDKSSIIYCSKKYIPSVDDQPIKTNIDHIILYTADMINSSDSYITNYSICRELYGDNALDNHTTELIQYLNN